MERATKERLTGAIILFAALAILVPEMLSGPGEDAAADETLADTGPPLTTYDLAIDPAAAPTRQQQLSGTAGEGAALSQAVPPPETAPVLSDSAASTPEPVAQPEAEPSAPSANAAAAEPQPRSAASGSQTRAASPATPSRATSAASKEGSTSAGHWWVQIGSFASEQNAQGLARKLRGQGFIIDVSLVRSGGKDLHRVRAGPEKDRAAASALRNRLAAAGQTGSLVAP